MTFVYYIRINGKTRQAYSTLGRANEGAKYRGGKVYGVAIVKGKPRIVARFYGICQCELNEEEKRIRLWV